MSSDAAEVSVTTFLDELTPKQRLKEYKSVQKALHSKDFAARLAALTKVSGDTRYFGEGNCLPSFLESLAPTKKLLEYVVPALTWFADELVQQASVPLSENCYTQLLLKVSQEEHQAAKKLPATLDPADVNGAVIEEAGGVVSVEEAKESNLEITTTGNVETAKETSVLPLACVHSLLVAANFKEELKKPKVKVSKKKDAPPPPPPPVEQAVYGEIRALALKCLYYLYLPLLSNTMAASDFYALQGQEQRERKHWSVRKLEAEKLAEDEKESKQNNKSKKHNRSSDKNNSNEQLSDEYSLSASSSPAAVTSMSGEDYHRYVQQVFAQEVPDFLSLLHEIVVYQYQIYRTGYQAHINTGDNTNNRVMGDEGTVRAYQNTYYALRVLGSVMRHSNHRTKQEKELLLVQVLRRYQSQTNIVPLDNTTNIGQNQPQLTLTQMLGEMVLDVHLSVPALSYLVGVTESLVLEEQQIHIFSDDIDESNNSSCNQLLSTLLQLQMSVTQQLLQQEQEYQAYVSANTAAVDSATTAAGGKNDGKGAAKPKEDAKGKGKTNPKEEEALLLQQQQQAAAAQAKAEAEAKLSLDRIDMVQYPILTPAQLSHQLQTLNNSASKTTDATAAAPSGNGSGLVRKLVLQYYYITRVLLRLSRRSDTVALLSICMLPPSAEENVGLDQLQRTVIFVVRQLQQVLLLDVVASTLFFSPNGSAHSTTNSNTNSAVKSGTKRGSGGIYEEEENLLDIHALFMLLCIALLNIDTQYISYSELDCVGYRKSIREILSNSTNNSAPLHVTVQQLLLKSKRILQLSVQPHLLNYAEFSSQYQKHASNTNNTYYSKHEHRGEEILNSHTSASTSATNAETNIARSSNEDKTSVYARLKYLFVLRKKTERCFLECVSYSTNKNSVGEESVMENHEELFLYVNHNIRNAPRLRRFSHHPHYTSRHFSHNDSGVRSDNQFSYVYYHDDFSQCGPFQLLSLENHILAATNSSTADEAVTATAAAATTATTSNSKTDKKGGKDAKNAAPAASTSDVSPLLVAPPMPRVSVLKHWLECLVHTVQDHHKISSSNTNNTNHVDLDLANRALRMMHLTLLDSRSNELVKLLGDTFQVPQYFVGSLGNYLDILLEYYLHQTNNSNNSTSHNLLLAEGDPSIEEALFDILALLEVCLPYSAEAIKTFALQHYTYNINNTATAATVSANKFFQDRFQRILHLLRTTGPVLRPSFTSPISSAEILLEKRVTVREPRESALSVCPFGLTTVSFSYSNDLTYTNKKQEVGFLNYDPYQQATNYAIQADYAHYGYHQHTCYSNNHHSDNPAVAHHSGGAQHHRPDRKYSVTEARGRNLHASHLAGGHLRALVWDVLAICVQSEAQWRVLLPSSTNANVNGATADSSAIASTMLVPPIITAEAAASLNNNNPALQMMQSYVSSNECETIASEIVLLFTDLAAQMPIVQQTPAYFGDISNGHTSANSVLGIYKARNGKSRNQNVHLSADWQVVEGEGVSVRALPSYPALLKHQHHQHLPLVTGKHHTNAHNQTATVNGEDLDYDVARNDVVCAAMRFMFQIGQTTTQGVVAALEGLVKTTVTQPYFNLDKQYGNKSYAHNKRNYRHQIGEHQEQEVKEESDEDSKSKYYDGSATMMGHLISSLQYHTNLSNSGSNLVSSDIASYFSLPWGAVGQRPRYFDDLFPAYSDNNNSNDKKKDPSLLFHPHFFLSQPHSWPFLALLYPFLAVLANPESPISLIEQTILTLQSLVQTHLSLFLPSHTQSVMNDLLAAIFVQLGGAHLLSGHLGSFGLCSSGFKDRLTHTQSYCGEASFCAYLLSRGMNRSSFWKNYHREKLAVKQELLLQQQQQQANNIDPKTGKPLKTNDKAKANDKNDKKKDTKGDKKDANSAGAVAGREPVVNDILFNHEDFPEDFDPFDGSQTQTPSHWMDPNHGPTDLCWALLLNRRAPSPQLSTSSIPLLHTLILGQIGNDSNRKNNASSSALALHMVSQLGPYIAVQCADNASNGCSPLMYALLMQDAPLVEALLHFTGRHYFYTDSTNNAHENQLLNVVDVNAVDAKGVPTMFYVFFGLQYGSQLTLNPAQHHFHHTTSSTSLNSRENVKAFLTKDNMQEYHARAIFKPQLYLYPSTYHKHHDNHNKSQSSYFPDIVDAMVQDSDKAFHLLGHASQAMLDIFFYHPAVTTTVFAQAINKNNDSTVQHQHHLHVATPSQDRHRHTLLLCLLGVSRISLCLGGQAICVQHEAYHLWDSRYLSVSVTGQHNSLRSYHKHHYSSNGHSNDGDISGSYGNVTSRMVEEEKVCRAHVLSLVQHLTRHLDISKAAAAEVKEQHRHALDVNACDVTGLNALCVAACHGHNELVYYLVDGLQAEVNVIDQQGMHLLHHLVSVAPYPFFYHSNRNSGSDEGQADSGKREHLMLYYNPEPASVTSSDSDNNSSYYEGCRRVDVFPLCDLFDFLLDRATNRPLLLHSLFNTTENTTAKDPTDANGRSSSDDKDVNMLALQLDEFLGRAFSALPPTSSLSNNQSDTEKSIHDNTIYKSPLFVTGRRLTKADLLTLTRQRLMSISADSSNNIYNSNSYSNSNVVPVIDADTCVRLEDSGEYSLSMLALAGPALLTPVCSPNNTNTNIVSGNVASIISGYSANYTHYLYDDVLPSRYSSHFFNYRYSNHNGSNASDGYYGHVCDRHTAVQRESFLRNLLFLHIWHHLESLIPKPIEYAGENVTKTCQHVKNEFLQRVLCSTISSSWSSDTRQSLLNHVNILHALAIGCPSVAPSQILTTVQQRNQRLVHYAHPVQAVLDKVKRQLEIYSLQDYQSKYGDDTNMIMPGGLDEEKQPGDVDEGLAAVSLWAVFSQASAPVSVCQLAWDRRYLAYLLKHFCSNEADTTLLTYQTPLKLSVLHNNLDLVDVFWQLTTDVQQTPTALLTYNDNGESSTRSSISTLTNRVRHLFSVLQPIVVLSTAPSVSYIAGNVFDKDLVTFFIDLVSHNKTYKDFVKPVLMSDIYSSIDVLSTDGTNKKVVLQQKALHLAIVHGQYPLLEALFDCPKIDVNSTVNLLSTNKSDSNNIVLDTVVSLILKRLSPTQAAYDSKHRYNWWLLLENIKDRLDLTISFSPSALLNTTSCNGRITNIVEYVALHPVQNASEKGTSDHNSIVNWNWETKLEVLHMLVNFRKNDVLECFLSPASSYFIDNNHNVSGETKCVHEVIAERQKDEPVLHTYVSELLRDVLDLSDDCNDGSLSFNTNRNSTKKMFENVQTFAQSPLKPQDSRKENVYSEDEAGEG